MAPEQQQPFDPASFEHIPVLLNECLEGLNIDPAGPYLEHQLQRCPAGHHSLDERLAPARLRRMGSRLQCI